MVSQSWGNRSLVGSHGKQRLPVVPQDAETSACGPVEPQVPGLVVEEEIHKATVLPSAQKLAKYIHEAKQEQILAVKGREKSPPEQFLLPKSCAKLCICVCVGGSKISL